MWFRDPSAYRVDSICLAEHAQLEFIVIALNLDLCCQLNHLFCGGLLNLSYVLVELAVDVGERFEVGTPASRLLSALCDVLG